MSKVEKVQITREIALTAVLSAAYAVAILLIIIPSPTGGYTHIGDFVVFVALCSLGIGLGVLWALLVL